jgi:hypothetical protein
MVSVHNNTSRNVSVERQPNDTGGEDILIRIHDDTPPPPIQLSEGFAAFVQEMSLSKLR